MSPLTFFALLPLAFWLGLTLDRRRAWPDDCVLKETASGIPAGAGSVAILVPARDEAEVLPETLPSLLAQIGPGAEIRVVLVDDGSTDGTAEVARRVAGEVAGESTGSLTVIQATPTPPGWTGKVHALACGVEAVSREVFEDTGDADEEPPEWLLFTDADIRHRPGSLASLLARAREGGDDRDGPFDLVSVMARLHAETFWERLLIPPFVFYFQLLYPFRLVRSRRSRVAAAAGGCVLVRRQTLEAAGGLAALHDAVIDDVSLARRVASAGGRTWLGLDPGIVSVRPYRGLKELWRMVARSAFVQLRYRWDVLVVVLSGLAVLVVSPPFVASAAAWQMGRWALEQGALGQGATAGSTLPALVAALVAALGAWALEGWALRPAVHHHRVAGGWAWTLPFSSILYGLMTFSSAWSHLTGRGARWKGRSYS